jgi:iron-sulfur cluster assembly protein
MIKKDILISEIFNKYPEKSSEIAEILMEAGIRCFGCAAASFESLEEGLKSHGLTDIEIEELINKINLVLKD